jgi:hypothetical protein
MNYDLIALALLQARFSTTVGSVFIRVNLWLHAVQGLHLKMTACGCLAVYSSLTREQTGTFSNDPVAQRLKAHTAHFPLVPQLPPIENMKEDLWSLRKKRNRQATAAVVARAESRTPAADKVSKAAAKGPAVVVEQKVVGSLAAVKPVDKAALNYSNTVLSG